MSDEPNGAYVRWREFDDHKTLSQQTHIEMRKRQDLHDERLRAVESWRDRIAGPITIIVAALAIIATVSNIVVVWAP